MSTVPFRFQLNSIIFGRNKNNFKNKFSFLFWFTIIHIFRRDDMKWLEMTWIYVFISLIVSDMWPSLRSPPLSLLHNPSTLPPPSSNFYSNSLPKSVFSVQDLSLFYCYVGTPKYVEKEDDISAILCVFDVAPMQITVLRKRECSRKIKGGIH